MSKGRFKEIKILKYRDYYINRDKYCFVLRKMGNNTRIIGYYATLEGVLKYLYNNLLIDNIDSCSTYLKDLKSLRKIMEKTREEFDNLFQNVNISKGGHLNENCTK